MAFLTTSSLLIQQLESPAGAGAGVVDIWTKTTSERIRELEFSIEVAKDDEASKYLTGDLAQNDESIIGMKTGTASYSIKVAPAQYNALTSGSILTYSSYLENAGLKNTPVNTNTLSGFYVFTPSLDKTAATATVARLVEDTTVSPATTMVEVLTGAMSNLTLSVDGVGAPFKLAFETMGAVGGVGISGVYNIPSTNVSGFLESGVMRTVADNFLNTTVSLSELSVGGVVGTANEFCINALTFETGNEITPIECQNNEAGIRNYVITGINPTLEIDPLLQTLTQFNYWTGFTSEKFYRVIIESQFIKLMIPRCQILNSAIADSNGFLRNTLSLRALRNIDKVGYDGVNGSGSPENLYYIIIKQSLSDY